MKKEQIEAELEKSRRNNMYEQQKRDIGIKSEEHDNGWLIPDLVQNEFVKRHGSVGESIALLYDFLRGTCSYSSRGILINKNSTNPYIKGISIPTNKHLHLLEKDALLRRVAGLEEIVDDIEYGLLKEASDAISQTSQSNTLYGSVATGIPVEELINFLKKFPDHHFIFCSPKSYECIKTTASETKSPIKVVEERRSLGFKNLSISIHGEKFNSKFINHPTLAKDERNLMIVIDLGWVQLTMGDPLQLKSVEKTEGDMTHREQLYAEYGLHFIDISRHGVMYNVTKIKL